MKSILLRASIRWILILQLILSVFLLVRGHNLPGGGFIGGLVAASSVILYMIAYNLAQARTLIKVKPEKIMGIGLLISACSGIFAIYFDRPYLTGLWVGEISIPGFGKIGLGTPFLFDIGIYFVVFGMTLSVAFALFERSGVERQGED